MSENKICQSCGMPMRSTEEFGGQDSNNNYCCYCTNEAGKLKSYAEVKQGFTQFIVKTQGVDISEAEKMAQAAMEKMPAWKKQS